MTMDCPSCRVPMEASAFANHIGHAIEIDVCWPCHLIWFDDMESVSLSAESVIDLFRRIHAHRGDTRNVTALQSSCPRCVSPLHAVQDMARNVRFSYRRCPRGDGRLISFVQFLREKQFVRSLNPAEVARLAVTLKQVRCSSCGAPIRLDSDEACTHCGAALSILDGAAVEKALAEYEARRRTVALPPAASPDAHGMSAKPYDLSALSAEYAASDAADLLLAGLNVLFAAWAD